MYSDLPQRYWDAIRVIQSNPQAFNDHLRDWWLWYLLRPRHE